jgi:hypothetical protein
MATQEHQHDYKNYPLPGEGPGRVYQCTQCMVIGFRRSRHGGLGKIVPYKCSHPECEGLARTRIPGRAARGAYIWACAAHSVAAEPVVFAPPPVELTPRRGRRRAAARAVSGWLTEIAQLEALS